VKPETNKQKLTDNSPPCIEGKLVKDHQELTNMFNEYFVNVVTNKSVDSISNNPTAINNLSSFYGETFPQIHVAPITTKEIEDIIKSLPSKNSSGYDEIPLRILKISMPLITSPLTYLGNKSISKGKFPSKAKILAYYPNP